MKTKLPLLLTAVLATTAFAHERITIGPNGGRVIFVDSPTTPNVEFLVNKEGRAEITLLDVDRKLLPPGERTLTVTGGPRASAKKLAAELKDGRFVTEPVPAGAPYAVVIQLKESAGAKPLTLRVNYDPRPAKSGKPEYLDDSVNDGSGPSIQPPATLEGLFGEINQHHAELKDNFKRKKYEPMDEVTQAFTVLLKALPGKSGDKSSAVQPQVDTLVADLAAIARANATRKLSDAAGNLASVHSGLAELRQTYPASVSNARLD
jgi:hypothetical protein